MKSRSLLFYLLRSYKLTQGEEQKEKRLLRLRTIAQPFLRKLILVPMKEIDISIQYPV